MAIYKRLISNFTLLAGSGFIVAALNVGTLSFTARGLGAEGFGALAVIQAFVTLVSRLMAFETWQPVLRLGTAPLESGGKGLAAVVLSGVTMDVLASVAAGAIGLAITNYGQVLLPLGAENRDSLYIYCITLFFALGGTPKGVFRLIDRFDLLVRYQILQASLLFVGAFVLYMRDGALWEYVCMIAVTYIAYNISLLVHMFFVIAGHVTESNWFEVFRDWRTIKRFFRMAFGTSMLSSLLGTRRSVEVFIVGHLCGEAGVGVYSAMARVTGFLPRFAEPIKQVVFPEITRLATRENASLLRDLIVKLSIAIAGFSAITAMVGIGMGDIIVTIFLGGDYAGNEGVFTFLLLSVLATISTVHLNPLIQVVRGVRVLVVVAFASYVMFLAIAIPVVSVKGVEGAAVASFVSEIMALGAIIFISYKSIIHGRLNKSVADTTSIRNA